jgi:thiamine biosynthesis lipoprotein
MLLMDYYQFRAMNSDITLGAEGGEKAVKASFALAKDMIDRNEKRFSRFLDDSELSRLNQRSGSWVEVSPELYELLDLSLAYYRITDGLFNPAILDNLEYAGYDRSIDEIRSGGVLAPVQRYKPLIPGLENLRLDEGAQSVFLPAGMRIDLGGIAKGWIGEQAAHMMSEQVSTCVVDAGGDMYMIGLPGGQPTWQVSIENPLDARLDIAILNVPPGAVATSSVVKRSWVQGGRTRHHLIDPRSGEPASTDWLTVTVVAPHAHQAEVFAKAMLIAGRDGAPELATQNPEIIAIAIDRLGNLWGTPNSKEVYYVASQYQS